MNSNKIINLVDFYQSIGVEYLIDDINIKSLQNQAQNQSVAPSVEPNLIESIINQRLTPKAQPYQPISANVSPNKQPQHMDNQANSVTQNMSTELIPQKPKQEPSHMAPRPVATPLKKEPPAPPAVVKKEIKLDHISTLDELKEELLKFDECSLKKTAINTVFGCGDENAEIMVIGEAPGAEEDASGEPFVGRSGKLLMKAIESIGMNRDKIFITNTIFWRPPGNRNPTIEEMQLCYPFLKRMIEIINPKLIIIVGKVATVNLIKSDEPIGKMRGKWYDLDFGGKTYLSRVVFHPSYLLRNSTQKKSLWLDLLDIKDKIKAIKIKD